MSEFQERIPKLYDPREPVILPDLHDIEACKGDFVNMHLGNASDLAVTPARAGLSIKGEYYTGVAGETYCGNLNITRNGSTEVINVAIGTAEKWIPVVHQTQVANYNISEQVGTWSEFCGRVDFSFSFKRNFRRQWRVDTHIESPFTVANDKFYMRSAFWEIANGAVTEEIGVFRIKTDGSPLQRIATEGIAAPVSHNSAYISLSSPNGTDLYALYVETTQNHIRLLDNIPANITPITTRTYKIHKFNIPGKSRDTSYEKSITQISNHWQNRFVPFALSVNSNRIYLCGNSFVSDDVSLDEHEHNIIQSYTHDGVYQPSELRLSARKITTDDANPFAGSNPDEFLPVPEAKLGVTGFYVNDTHAYIMAPSHEGRLFFMSEFPISNHQVAASSTRFIYIDRPAALSGLGRDSGGNFYFSQGALGIIEDGISMIDNEEFSNADPTFNFTRDWVEFDAPTGVQISNCTGTVTNGIDNSHAFNTSNVHDNNNKIRVEFNTSREYEETIYVSGSYFKDA